LTQSAASGARASSALALVPYVARYRGAAVLAFIRSLSPQSPR